MKATTLASLLVASTVAGAAAGGPFWLAYTVPFAQTSNSWTSMSGGVEINDFPTATSNMVITDIDIDYFSSNPRRFSVLINGQSKYSWTAFSDSTGRSGQFLRLQHGIPVPLGSTIQIQSGSLNGNDPACSISQT